MTSVVTCPHCREQVANDPSLAGQAVQCPHCQRQFTLPALATVRAVKPAATVPPIAAGPSFPLVDTSPKVSTAGGRYRKPKQSVPVWAWIVGGFGVLVVFCCGGPMLMLPNAEQMRQANERAEERKHKQFMESLNKTDSRPEWERNGFKSEAEREEWVAREAARQAGVSPEMMRGWNDLPESERQRRVAEEMLRRQGIE